MSQLHDSAPQKIEKQQQQQTSSEGSDSYSESESEPSQPQINTNPIQSAQPLNVPSDSSSGDDESDSETAIKKVNSTVELTQGDIPKNASSKNSKSNIFETPSTVAGAKRSAEIGEGSRRSRKKSIKTDVKVDDSEVKKLKPFHRLWSENDEIALLRGMIDYRLKVKSCSITDSNDFHGFIKKSINIDVTNAQVLDKIRKLKKKYENNLSKKNDGNEKIIWKPHDHSVYKLSESLWGSNNLNLAASKREDVIKESGGGCSCEEDCFHCWIGRNGWKLLKGDKREEMEEKKMKVRLKQMEVNIDNLKFKLEYANMVFEAAINSV